MTDSVVFDWDPTEFESLVANCTEDDTVQIAMEHLPRDGLILEAGCGPGHVVQYLLSRGFQIEGIEINAEVVRKVLSQHQGLPIKVGNVTAVCVPDGYYSGLISFGVIEHFPDGLEAPLLEHFRVLRPGGIAVISVPSLNLIRRVKNAYRWIVDPFTPRLNPLVRRIAGKKRLMRNIRGRDGFRFHVNPRYGKFFEYWLTLAEFETAVRRVGFEIKVSVPTHYLVRLWTECGDWWIRNENRSFTARAPGKILDWVLSTVPFVHNHMHTLVVVKPNDSSIPQG